MANPGHASTEPAVPVLTAAVLGVTAAVSTAGLITDSVLLALRRDAIAISDGQLWRLLTSLLVQDGGVTGTVFNLLGLALVGIAAERRFGWRAWLVAYLVGGLSGEVAGWAGWQPDGAGNSVGVCGLAGALAMVVLRGTGPPGRPEIITPTTWAVALTSGTLTGWAPALAAVAAALSAAARPLIARWVLIALVAGPSVLLLAQRDIHGAALTGGLLVGVVHAPSRTPNRPADSAPNNPRGTVRRKACRRARRTSQCQPGRRSTNVTTRLRSSTGASKVKVGVGDSPPFRPFPRVGVCSVGKEVR